MPKFESMNETDVREVIVRPFLHRLGYEHGTEANIRTEQTFRYAKAFLGRKNPSKDPDLVGRADYILEVSSVGRWVTEVKGPSEPLSRDAVEQAHTYAAHPEVAALYFLLTNGREFRLYRTGSLDTPLMGWSWPDMEEVFLAVYNLLSPDAIRKKLKLLEPDPGKPLAAGIKSEVQIIGGFVRYEDHYSSHPFLRAAVDISGLELPVTGGLVRRRADGQIHGQVKVAKSMPMAGELSELLERADGYDFFSSDPIISSDVEKPTIFQNFIENDVPLGTAFSVPGMGRVPMPFSMRFTSVTDAIGFVEGNTFKGTMQLTYEFFLANMSALVRSALEQQFGPIPKSLHVQGGGIFQVDLLDR